VNWRAEKTSVLRRPIDCDTKHYALLTVSTTRAAANRLPRPSEPGVVRLGGRAAQGRVAVDRRAEPPPRHPVRARGRGALRALARRRRVDRARRATSAVRRGRAGSRETRSTVALWVQLVATMGPDELAAVEERTFRQWDRASLSALRIAIDRRRRDLSS